MTSPDDLIPLEGGGRNVVHRRGNVVIRDAGPWTLAVHSLLRHLERPGFAGAPRLVGSGLDPDSRETLTFIEGQFTQPGPVIPDMTTHPIAPWAMAWRARSAAWMIRNRRALETALNRGAA